MSDETLFERYRGRGDASALGELFDRAAPALLRIAVHLARDPAAAEDLVQATFLRAIEARATWTVERPIMPWLCGILQNRARSARRSEERTPDPARLPSRMPTDPARVAEAAEFDAAVDAAIAGLPEPYQPVMRLHLAYGHAPAEIAHALSRPPGTVRSQLARGLELLRKTLPVGITGAVALSAGRGLAAVRASMLLQATAAAPLTPFVGVLSGATLAMKAMVPVLGLLALAGLAWFTWPRTDLTLPPEVATTSDPARVADVLEPGAPPVDSGGEAQNERTPLLNAPDVATAALNIHCRWEDDSSHAAGVTLTVTPKSVADGLLRARTGITAADGMLLVLGLPPGRLEVYADRGGGSTVDVASGVVTRMEFTIPHGVNVRGHVVDEQGDPIPLAQIWLSIGRRNFSDGRYVTTAGADGSFELRSVAPERFVGAIARGWRAAVPEPIQGETGSTIGVELMLRGRGVSLLGTVNDAAGAPVAGALVVVGFRETRVAWSRGGLYSNYRPPVELETDVEGRFRADGLEPGGRVELWVGAPGACTWFQWIELEADADTTVAVRLQRGASVRGRVTDEEGNAVPGVWLLARSTAWFGTGLELDDLYGPDWVGSNGFTDADGRYKIEALTPGTLLLRASTKDRVVRSEIPAADEETVTWNPVLAECVIHGRVVDAKGMPLVGWRVGGTPSREQGRQVSDTTDAEGKFRLKPCLDVPYRLGACAGDDHAMARPFTLFDVRPREAEWLVQIPDEAIPSSSITGRFLDEDGRPFESAEVCCMGDGFFSCPTVETDRVTGGFRIAPLPSGSYRLRGSTGRGDAERHTGWSEPFVIADHQDLDMGVLQMPIPGTVVATVRTNAGMPLDGVTVGLVEDSPEGDCLGICAETEGGTVQISGVAPGDYRICVRGEGIPAVYEVVHVQSGEEAHVEIEVSPGIACRLRLLEPSEPVPNHLTFAWTRDGLRWERYINLWAAKKELSYSTRFLPGTYEVTVTSESGKQEVSRFILRASDPPDREIQIVLP